MPDPGAGMRFFTLQEANDLLPTVRGRLASLRALRSSIIKAQAGGPQADRDKILSLLGGIDRDVKAFHKGLEDLQALGCELKDLERGLVDFHSMRGNQVVLLCWMDGEESIGWWHPVDSGFNGRQAL
jgi:hypothetical protein